MAHIRLENDRDKCCVEQARQVQEAVEATKLDLNQKNWKGCVNNCLRAK